MKSFELKAELRENLGKTSSKKFRAEGKVPAVVYGLGDNTHILIKEKEFNGLIFTPNSHIVELDIEGKKTDAILREVQYHPVTDNVLHVDFLRISDEKPLQIKIPVKVTGRAEGVKQGGKLQIMKRYLTVKGMRKDLPDFLPVDVTEVTLGKSFKVDKLSFENLEIMDSPNTVIAAVKLTRAAKGAQDTAGEASTETPTAES